jgi:hypothetical protein
MTNETPAGHLESSDVAAYLDRTLQPAERDRVEAHLAHCPECRRELIDVSRVRNAAGRRSRWLIVVPAAAAAAIAVLIIARPATTPPGGEPVLRDGVDGSQPSLVLVTPPDSGVARERPLTFTWRSAGTDVSYRLTITDSRGDVVWSVNATDTTAPLPPTVRLTAGSTYYWYVDGLLPAGRSITSGIRPFTVP